MSEASEKNVYRVSGFTCANCANKFEKNVQQLDSVADAKVNFGALKITVYGEATVQQIEQAGAFENIKIFPEKEEIPREKESYLKKYGRLSLAAFFLLIGFLVSHTAGDTSLPAIAAYVLSMIIGGYSLFKTGLQNLIKLDFDMRTLMTIAIIGAALIGEWSEGAVVVILFAISEALESYSMNKARKSISSLMDIAPKEALIRRHGREFTVKVEDIEIGDTLLVKPGQKIAMDGNVEKGFSAVNQAAITGESIPAEKGEGSEVFAGTLNGEGLLEIKVTKRAEDTTLAKIIHLVEEAQAEKAPSQAFIEKFARYYTPAIMVIAFFTAILPPLFGAGSFHDWLYQGLSVLVVGCPCALVISTPISIVTAIGNAARNGILIKGGIYLEELGALEAIAFDKTGTLTKGTPAVTELIFLDKALPEALLLGYMAALEARSDHPLAQAIVKAAGKGSQPADLQDFSSITGRGVKGVIDGRLYYIGSPALFSDTLSQKLEGSTLNEISRLQREGSTVMVFGTEEKVLAIIGAADEIRENSRSVVEQLHMLGIKKTVMLTGDNVETAKSIGAAAGVSDVKAELLPEDKLAEVKKLKNIFSKTAMAGDGVNDAPALAAASVGIAMGGAGTDTALETADVALMGDDLSKLPYAIVLSRKTLAIIKQNVAFSIGIKAAALLLVIPSWLTLWIAIFADMGATLIVTLNSLRLVKIKDRQIKRSRPQTFRW
ncbi:cadmium-translocating P-type ATPase [Metabacillus sp. GX 13764]|uniref:heavy metal translocating P-type ATPase n=1 Tax=Metabacillus kandeliae TaxID=2900151 RepID=UPI001E363707|nr:cadmium-translocating P-type ATPase [Metabacillus kandeliae]